MTVFTTALACQSALLTKRFYYHRELVKDCHWTHIVAGISFENDEAVCIAIFKIKTIKQQTQ
jgi:hypothetical protein